MITFPFPYAVYVPRNDDLIPTSQAAIGRACERCAIAPTQYDLTLMFVSRDTDFIIVHLREAADYIALKAELEGFVLAGDEAIRMIAEADAKQAAKQAAKEAASNDGLISLMKQIQRKKD